MLYLGRRGIRPGDPLPWLGPHIEKPPIVKAKQESLAWIEAHADRELTGLVALLEESGLLRRDGANIYTTAKGFERMEDLRRGAIASNQAFVAMWFGDEMSEVYEQAIEPAITEAGFRSMRIDRKEHVNKIDDEIIAEIKRSRFVVADFTCGIIQADGRKVSIPRGGVYYEAGFAQGMAIPVIWTVRNDQIAEVHFDIRQFNHIAWTDYEDLKRRLVNRIRALFADAS